MDVAAISTMLSQANIMQKANISVMKMAMDSASQNGTAIRELAQTSAKTLEMSLNPHVGGKLDIKI